MLAINYARDTSNTPRREYGRNEASRVTEILLHNSQVSLHPVLLPMIAQLSRDSRWLTLVNPPADLSRELLNQAGAVTGHILSLHSRDGKHEPLKLCQQALSAGTSHTVITWCESGRTTPLHQLDLAATQGGAQAILVRH
ncbi:SulA-like leucine-rich domain-containing protein [Marinobacterium maritimum]|uniref:SulA-like leucine-rich domain-containing protein n=1 Tax=Marinobacterium maritimum TaxID=500162 RepID=A0ABP3T655_9GAMM